MPSKASTSPPSLTVQGARDHYALSLQASGKSPKTLEVYLGALDLFEGLLRLGLVIQSRRRSHHFAGAPASIAMLLAAAWAVMGGLSGQPVEATAFPPLITPAHGAAGTVVHVELRIFDCPLTSGAALGKLPPLEQDPIGNYIAKTWTSASFVAGSVRTGTYNGQSDLTGFDFVVPDVPPAGTFWPPVCRCRLSISKRAADRYSSSTACQPPTSLRQRARRLAPRASCSR